MTVPLRAALHLRVSTARQAEHNVSIPDQKRQGEAYCASRGYQLIETYVEPGASPPRMIDAPKFQRMIEAGASKPAPFDIVIVHSFSRFFRDHFELEFYVRRLAKYGVRLAWRPPACRREQREALRPSRPLPVPRCRSSSGESRFPVGSRATPTRPARCGISMRRTPFRPAFILIAAPLLAAALLGAPLAQAQGLQPKPSAATTDAAFATQKAAFLALPAATRIAAQDALVWLGLYNGTNDGDFGKRTRDAIVAFQTSQKAPGDGVLSPGQLQTLLAAGDKARAAVGFQTLADPKTGARFGAPMKLLGAKSGVTLDFASDPGGDLAALYARLSAESPTRKVAYKAIKPGAFFVVTGQDTGRKFYTRYDLSDAATPPIRGFTFAYPTVRNDLDRVALAVANAFVAFPPPGPAIGAAAPPEPPQPKATALIVAPDRALTALKPQDCPNPSVGGKPVRFERTDPATGLALLSGEFGAAKAPSRGALAPGLVVLSADGGRVAAVPAALASGARPAVVASLGKNAAGGPVFDRQGGLAGVVAPIAEEPKRVGGVAVAGPHALIDAEAIGAFLGGGALTPIANPAPLSAGAIAAREKTAVAAVMCGK